MFQHCNIKMYLDYVRTHGKTLLNVSKVAQAFIKCFKKHFTCQSCFSLDIEINSINFLKDFPPKKGSYILLFWHARKAAYKIFSICTIKSPRSPIVYKVHQMRAPIYRCLTFWRDNHTFSQYVSTVSCWGGFFNHKVHCL